ncbi:hypothetical protein PHMEG_00022157 [Phytophthora megakarya]|uniref:Winged helix-turn helix domain-containing protein n=1 Tax=Phytophthora megakarya TaxID=4795 RepID=A0A225VME4_9STRA|nr:hypothetical protein PHMEG_00022157 [Phytophthora megakarya]
MGGMQEAVTKQYAHPNTVMHCLYGFYNLGYSRKKLEKTTIGNWIRVYEATGTFELAHKATDKKFTTTHRAWLYEAQDAFVKAHNITISKSTVRRIFHEFGLTWKFLERRTMHIKEQDVLRFVDELAHIDWSYHNLFYMKYHSTIGG